MKKITLAFIAIITFAFSNFFQTVNAQTCDENNFGTIWTHIPNFDGDDSYFKLSLVNSSDDYNFVTNYLNGDFTIDLWIKPTFPASSTEKYTIFTVGDWDDGYHCIFWRFVPLGDDEWEINISDGPGEATDMYYNIDYQKDYQDKWVHLAITFNDATNDLRMLVNGNFVASVNYDFQGSSHWHCTFMGENIARNWDFRGYASAIRVWNTNLSDDDIHYVYDKWFTMEEQMIDSERHLFGNLQFNMFTERSSENPSDLPKIHSLVNKGNIYIEEGGIVYSTDVNNPTRPPRPIFIEYTRECSSIRFDWYNSAEFHGVYDVYRDGVLRCRTSDMYFVDDEVEAGVTYDYMIQALWYNPNDPLGFNDGYYDSEDDYHASVSSTSYKQVTNFIITDDATMNNCNGQVKLKWTKLDSTPVNYYIKCRTDTGVFNTIADSIDPDIDYFTHNVSPDSLGLELTYVIDAGGDGCENFSDEVTGLANMVCSTEPMNPNAVVDGDNIRATWDYTQSGAPATAFRIYRSMEGGGYDLMFNEIDVDEREFVDTTAKMCIEYSYKIEAYNSCGSENAISVATPVAKIPVKFDNIFTYTDDAGNEKAYFDASKGYYNNRVELDWDVNPDKKADIERYEIYRRKTDESNFVQVTYIDNANATNYIDENVEANQMYEYLIRATGHCGVDEKISDTLKTVGFRTSTGIVSGKITFTGGNTVADVEVQVSTDNPVTTSSMYFDGLNNVMCVDPMDDNYLDSVAYNPLSFEAWIRPKESMSGDKKVIFSVDSLLFNLYLSNMHPVLVLNNTTYGNDQTPLAIATSDTVLDAEAWYHIAFSLDPVAGEIKLYLNSELIASDTYTPVIPWCQSDMKLVQIGGSVVTSSNYAFYGNIDEVRLWHKVRTQDEIRNDYKRYLTGKEDSILAYWHFDENYGDYTYDISRNGQEFNKCNLRAYSDTSSTDKFTPQWSSQVPAFEQLHPAGISDEKGNYVVDGIRYAGEGQIYNVSPSYGVHEFDPSDVNVFISDNNPVHNSIDFTDISSFRVTGSVTYENTNMPVADCYVKIDGKYINGEDNTVIKTDQNGAFDIQVPIGEHYLSVEKYGHTFVSAYYPEKANDSTIVKHYFNEPIYGVKFYDNTLVKLAGKVVGGAVEDAKPLGSNVNPTKNNLGVCQITFTTTKGYMLQNGKTDTTIYTNSNTGMYEIELCPESYIISTVKIGTKYNLLKDNEAETVSMDDCFTKQYTVDTVTNEGITSLDTVFEYNKQKDWIYRSTPEITVKDISGSELLGDSLFIVNPGNEISTTIKIASDTGSVYYAFGHPVFSQEKHYGFIINAFERYENNDNDDVDTVPVIDGNVVIINECANNQNLNSLSLNENGEVVYDFFGGLPNISSPYTKKIEIKLNIGEDYYDWSESPLYGYVAGNIPTGNNFVSEGPTSVDFILRDPPGSDSYSYLEESTEFTKSCVTTVTREESGTDCLTFHYGAEITTSAGGIGFSIQTTFENENDVSFIFEHSNTWGNVTETTETMSFNQSVSTSSDPAYVGDMGDLFFGHSTNLIYGLSDFITIIGINDVPSDAEVIDTITVDTTDYVLLKKQGLNIGSKLSTTFIYTQNHIINYLIPNLVMLRNMAYDRNKEFYTLNITDSESEEYLSNNDDSFIWGDAASDDKFDGPSYVFDNSSNQDIVDSVRYYNNQIISWRNTLALNEKCKINGEVYDQYPRNISFDAGSNYEGSVTVDTTGTTTKTYEFMLAPSLAANLGFSINKYGFSLSIEEGYSYTENTEETVEQTNEQTVGFVLEDGDQGDYFSLDIRKDVTAGFGPVFLTRGGQSSCPFEGASYTQFYEPGKIINQATMQIEVPAISVDNNIVAGVPENIPATYNLALSNNSETGDDGWYSISVDAASNPYGAKIYIDGDPATSEGKSILIPAGQTVYKTLTIEKGQPDVNVYDSIIVILHSLCQFDPTDDVEDIADSVYLSAYFEPACTTVDFKDIYDQWIANKYNNDTLTFEITNYDLNSSKFNNIAFQYAKPGGQKVNQMIFYKDEDDYNDADEPKTWLASQATVSYNFPLSDLTDGNYELYLKTVCDDGSEYVTDPLTGIIDRVSPRAFGNPQPADGVLDPNDNISLLFNEEIDAGDLYAHPDYIRVTGIPNGTDLIDNEYLLHDASVHFDGENDNLTVNSEINLNNTSFTVEFWAKREANGRECMISLGDADNGLWIGFDNSDKFVFKLGQVTVTSSSSYTSSDDWVFYSCVFHVADASTDAGMTMYALSGQGTEMKYQDNGGYFDASGTLTAGYCFSDGSAFKGNIHELRIWNVYRVENEITSQKSLILNGYELGLLNLWHLNEADGAYANDIASGKTAEVNASWQVSRDGKSLSFDGTGYATAPADKMIFDNQSDFTIEFWFKAQATGNDMCLFSNGKSDGSLSSNAWSVIIKSDKSIQVRNNGDSVSFDASRYLDNSWQHFALTLNRYGYLTLLMNGEAVKTAQGSEFGGFGADRVVLGAYWSELDDVYSDLLTGNIDEFRVWNKVKTAKQVNTYRNQALKCDEFGLKAYYSFEDVSNPDPTVSTETLANMTKDDEAVAGDLTLTGGVNFDTESPKIKLQGAEVELPFTYIVNDDNVIIEPSMSDADIEKTVLNVSVKNVKDMHNNRMASTVNWSLFVNRNQLVWSEKSIDIEKYIDEEKSFTVDVVNQGGISQNWQIENVPDWMEVDITQGTLDPLTSQTVNVTIKSQVNLGIYNRNIYLVSSMGFKEKLNINLTVKAHEPDWTVTPADYNYSLNVIGQLKIEGVVSTDINDIVAAFINGECRGVANVSYIESGNMYLVFMDVYDNNVSGGDIEFKVFDASTGEVYSDVSPVLAFQSDKMYGSSSEPVIIDASQSIEQYVALNKGWSWVSFDVYSNEYNDVNKALEGMKATQGDVIKSSDSYAQYSSSGSWEGTLAGVNYKEMYKIKSAQEQILTMSGMKVISDTVTIDVVKGWNWIGYPSQNQISIANALSALNPQAGDLIKSQQRFAVYDDILGWLGSLDYLKPSLGYMLYSGKDGIVKYIGNLKGSFSDNEDVLPDIIVTADNMTMIAEISGDNGNDYQLEAYSQGQLCGYAEPVTVGDRNLYFITINSNSGSVVSFKVKDDNNTYDADEHITFVPNNNAGTIDKPFIISINADEITDDLSESECVVTPNPFVDKLNIDINVSEDQSAVIELYNVSGAKVLMKDNVMLKAGLNKFTLTDEISHLKTGVYVLKIKTSDGESVFNVVKGK
ncbi:MAG: T9SS type A sorting domain-containing protein [Chlorobi bacterium]|nr:T9SS type A sorting domain-containing protein [Chlorobiota bacterium]